MVFMAKTKAKTDTEVERQQSNVQKKAKGKRRQHFRPIRSMRREQWAESCVWEIISNSSTISFTQEIAQILLIK